MQTNGEIVIRRAREADLPALGKLGALLLRTHYQRLFARLGFRRTMIEMTRAVGFIVMPLSLWLPEILKHPLARELETGHVLLDSTVYILRIHT